MVAMVAAPTSARPRRARGRGRRTAATPRAPRARTRDRSGRRRPAPRPGRPTGTSRNRRSARTSPDCCQPAIQCGAFPSCSSKPRPQSQRIEPPDPGQQPDESRERDRRRDGERLGRDERRGQELDGQRRQVGRADREAPATAARRASSRAIPSGSSTHARMHRLERLRRPLATMGGQRRRSPRSSRSAGAPGRARRHRALELEPRRVGQEMPDGRPGRTGLLVQRRPDPGPRRSARSTP